MRPFVYKQVQSAPEASKAMAGAKPGANLIAGGTTLLDLMKLNVMAPERLIDINRALSKTIDQTDAGLKLGAMVRMAQAATDARIVKDYPVVAQSLLLAASGQIRNMASLGGNVLQRTRCGYFRDQTVPNCNKRVPGSGCAAWDGENRMHAVLGVSENCIATYGSDFAQALMALDARVEILGRDGPRTIAFSKLHVMPLRDATVETTLAPDDVITGFVLPVANWTRRSLYLKIRDRESYAYALASVAVALDMDGNRVREARIAIGGVASVPWRAKEAEALLAGKVLDAETAKAAGAAAFAGSTAREHNAYKPALGRETIARALLQAQALEI